MHTLKPDGRAVSLDKFLPDGQSISIVRRFLNLFGTILGTDINQRLSDLMNNRPCETGHEEPSIVGGAYRVVLLKKK